MCRFTASERRWIERLRRTMVQKPADVMLYVCDYDLFICKRGVKSTELADGIQARIECCVCVSDIHDQGMD